MKGREEIININIRLSFKELRFKWESFNLLKGLNLNRLRHGLIAIIDHY